MKSDKVDDISYMTVLSRKESSFFFHVLIFSCSQKKCHHPELVSQVRCRSGFFISLDAPLHEIGSGSNSVKDFGIGIDIGIGIGIGIGTDIGTGIGTGYPIAMATVMRCLV